MNLDKPWHEFTAEEREAARAEERRSNGAEECDECGDEDYEHNMIHHENRVYCVPCCEEKGIEVPEEAVITEEK